MAKPASLTNLKMVRNMPDSDLKRINQLSNTISHGTDELAQPAAKVGDYAYRRLVTNSSKSPAHSKANILLSKTTPVVRVLPTSM